MRKTVAYFLALFIMLDALLLIASASFLLTLGQKSYYLTKFDSNDYINSCTSNIQSGISDLGLASGIPESAVTGAVVRTDVKLSVNRAISNEFVYINGRSTSISSSVGTQMLSSKLNESITSYAKKTSTTLSGDETQAIVLFINKCDTIYGSDLIQIPYFNTASSYIKKILTLCRFAVFISALMLIILITISCFLSSGHGSIFLRFRYSLYGLICAGAFTTFSTAVILLSDMLYRLNFTSSAARSLAGSLISGLFVAALIMGLSVLTICIICFFIMRQSLSQ